MGWKASQMQIVLDLVKCWWIDGFQKYKINGQLAIEIGQGVRHGALIDYVSRYVSQGGSEIQLRGFAHSHLLLWRRIGPEDEEAVRRLLRAR